MEAMNTTVERRGDGHVSSSRLLTLMIAGVAVFISACDSADQSGAVPSAPRQSTAPPPATSTTIQSPEEKAKKSALAAYRGMWQDFVEAGRTSDWRSPKLGRHATGIALTTLSRGLYADHYNGLVTKGEPKLSPKVSTVEPIGNPRKVVVSDCGDSTNWLKYRVDNGRLADKEPGGRQAINAIVEKQSDGSWKVSDVGVHNVGTC